MDQTIKRIREQTKTDRRGYEQFLDHFANCIVKIALWLHLTPLQLTFFWVVGQFLVTFLFLIPHYASTVLGVILFQCMFLVDLSDGKLSRFQRSTRSALHEKPLFPKYLDRLGHFLNDSLLFVFLGIGTSLRFGGALDFSLGMVAAFFFLANKAISVNPAWYKSVEEQLVVTEAFLGSHPRSRRGKFRQFFFDFMRVEHLFNFLFFGIVFDKPHVVLFVYAFIFFFEFVRKLGAQGGFLLREDRKRDSQRSLKRNFSNGVIHKNG